MSNNLNNPKVPHGDYYPENWNTFLNIPTIQPFDKKEVYVLVVGNLNSDKVYVEAVFSSLELANRYIDENLVDEGGYDYSYIERLPLDPSTRSRA